MNEAPKVTCISVMGMEVDFHQISAENNRYFKADFSGHYVQMDNSVGSL